MSEHTPEDFMVWFRTNYPGPGTIIHKPDWHAPKIYSAALALSAYKDLLAACRMVVAAQSPEEYFEAREAAENAIAKAKEKR